MMAVVNWPIRAGSSPADTISIFADCSNPESAHLTLRFRQGGGDVTQTIQLRRRQLHFGGCRWYAVCPVTGQPVLKLYFDGKRFVSRKATGLSYECQREAWMFRALRGSQRLRRKLERGITPPWDFGFPERPRRMWRSKYERIKQRASGYEALCDHFERGNTKPPIGSESS